MIMTKEVLVEEAVYLLELYTKKEIDIYEYLKRKSDLMELWRDYKNADVV